MIKNCLIFFAFVFILLSFPKGTLAATLLLNPTEDAFIQEWDPDQNYGSSQDLYSGLYSANDNRRNYTYLKFNVGTIARGSVINSASLRLEIKTARGLSSAPLAVHKSARNWSEGTIKWSNAPQPDRTGQSTNSAGNSGRVEFPVKFFVQDWADGRDNFGLVVIPNSEEFFYRAFYSRESGVKPSLYIDYTPPAVATPTPRSSGLILVSFRPVALPTPTPVVIVPRLDIFPPTLSNININEITQTSAKFTWKTNENATSWIYYGTSGQVNLVTGRNDAVTSHTVTLTNLTPGTTYSYKLMSRDSSSNAGFSSIKEFKTLEAGVGARGADPTPEPSSNPDEPAPSAGGLGDSPSGDNPLNKAKEKVEDKVADALVNNSQTGENPGQAGPNNTIPSEGDQTLPVRLMTKNPLVLIAGTVGINKMAGILLILAGLLTLVLLYLFMHTTKKIHGHIKSKFLVPSSGGFKKKK